MTEDLGSWLLHHHPVLRELHDCVAMAVAREPATLDDLVVRTCRPQRAVLISLWWLERQGDVAVHRPGMFAMNGCPPPRLSRSSPQPRLTGFEAEYVKSRPRFTEPALVWGQRRVTSASALHRAALVVEAARRVESDPVRVIFVGDDDLVSPLVAAQLGRRAEIVVVEVDGTVLADVDRVGVALGQCEIVAVHSDVEDYRSESHAHVVVADPFPTYDGSFEAVFWSRARNLLTPGGVLVSTMDPSHKPPGYSAHAAMKLSRLGFDLVEWHPASARYESFDFDLTAWEASLLDGFAASSSLSHTKATFVARAGRPPAQSAASNGRLGAWGATWSTGYLAAQSALDSVGIIETRAPSARCAANSPVSTRQPEGFAVAQLVTMDSGQRTVNAAIEAFAARGASLTPEDRVMLRGLERDQGFAFGDATATLPSLVRVIHSWARHLVA